MRHLLLLLLLSALSQAYPVTFSWDANAPEDAIDEYRLYRREEPVAFSYVYTLILGTPQIQAVAYVDPGWIIIVRAYNGLESPDSNSVTIPPPPKPPTGLKIVKLKIESSDDLTHWITVTSYAMDMTDRQFFRLVME